jgi:hypothetical protein
VETIVVVDTWVVVISVVVGSVVAVENKKKIRFFFRQKQKHFSEYDRILTFSKQKCIINVWWLSKQTYIRDISMIIERKMYNKYKTLDRFGWLLLSGPWGFMN